MIADRWGVTDEDVARTYPCDDFVPHPVAQTWRGVFINATPERIWPWIAQIQLAPYSYDWIDNLGRRSPQRLQGLQNPVVGERFTTVATRSVGRILSVQSNWQLTGRIGAIVMSYVLAPKESGTRLLLKIVTPTGRLLAPVLSLGDLVMARRQLLNIKRLAEQEPSSPSR